MIGFIFHDAKAADHTRSLDTVLKHQTITLLTSQKTCDSYEEYTDDREQDSHWNKKRAKYRLVRQEAAEMESEKNFWLHGISKYNAGENNTLEELRFSNG